MPATSQPAKIEPSTARGCPPGTILHVVCLFAALGMATAGCTPQTPATPVKVEFRFAQLEPADELEEMIAPGRDGAPGETIYVEKNVFLTNADVSSARAVTAVDGSPAVDLRFVDARHDDVREKTERNIGRNVAIFVDGALISTPRIRDRFGSGAMITGGFDRAEAQRIARGITAK